MTNLDPYTSFELREEQRDETPQKPDIDKLRESWGTGSEAQRGLQAALGVTAQARKKD